MTDADRLRADPDALDRLIEEHRILKETVENSPVLFCVYDAEDRLLAWNGAYEKMHPEAFNEMHAAPPGTRLSYGELVRHQIAQELSADEVDAEVERRVALQRNADGTPQVRHYASLGWSQVYKYRLPSGAVAGLAIDLNNLKRREAELIAARQSAETAERVKAGFLAKMSHEIRTPMNGIIGMAETLTETALSPDQRLSLDTILSSGEALLKLINDILDFSKIEAGKMELARSPFSLLEEAEALCRLLAPCARAEGLELILDIDPGLNVPLIGDSVRLRQIMTNLLGNALKFTPAGHVLLRIDGQDHDGSTHRCVTITVQDTGIGIPADRQKTVFQPFEQVRHTEGQHVGGTGLGLSITADLVAAMQGELTLVSDHGRGSTFECRLTLPLARRQNDGLPRAPVPAAQAGARGAIHLVDPSHLHGASIQRTLRHLGFLPHHWLSVADFEVSRDALHAPARIVISDRALPADMAECAAVLRRLAPPTVPCLLLWNRRTAPPPHPREHVLLEPAPLAGWHDALCDGPRAQKPPAIAAAAMSFELDVLVAEDNRTNRLVLERMLRTRVARLDFAENGRLAVEQAIARPPDVILMDMAMPVMDGLEATRRIRADEARQGRRPSIIIALTANAMASDREACLAAGMDDFLTKPVRLDGLMQVLASLDTRPRLRA